GTAPASFFERPLSLVQLIDRDFVAVTVLVAIVSFLALLIRILPDAGADHATWRRLCVLLGAGVVAHFGYVATRSNFYPRYFFLGVALVLALVALTLVIMSKRARAVALAAIVMVTLVLDPSALLSALARTGRTADHAERLAIVATLNANPAVPYGAESWTTIYQFVYPRNSEGTWAYGRDVARFAGLRYFSLIDRIHTRLNGDFARAVVTYCTDLTPSALRLGAYDCAAPFWDAYLPATVPLVDPPPHVAGLPEREGGECNVEWFGDGARTGNRASVAQGDVGGIFGWAGDVTASDPAVGLTVMLVDEAANRFFVPALPEVRPGLASYFSNPAMARSAFRAAISYGAIPAGGYDVWLLISTESVVLRCDARLAVDVVPTPSS
ncbi:MAG: hypothetical protein ABI797_02905, partial [Chloroflexota bacterium]